MAWFGPRNCNCGCNSVCVCQQDEGNCLPITAPVLEISNVPDIVYRYMNRQYEVCPGRTCRPTEQINQYGYYEITGFGEINGTYVAETYTFDDDTWTATPAAYDPTVCKWWGFPKVTFELTWAWNTEIDWDAHSLGSACASTGDRFSSDSGTFEVRLDTLMGCLYPIDYSLNLELLQFFRYINYSGGGTGFIDHFFAPSPLKPVIYNRNIDTFLCAKTADSVEFADITDTRSEGFNNPLLVDFDGSLPPTELLRQDGLGMLMSNRSSDYAGPGFYRGVFPTLNTSLPSGVPAIELGGTYYSGSIRETDDLVLVRQSFCELELESSDIDHDTGFRSSGSTGTDCDVYVTEYFSPFRVTRNWYQ